MQHSRNLTQLIGEVHCKKEYAIGHKSVNMLSLLVSIHFFVYIS